MVGEWKLGESLGKGTSGEFSPLPCLSDHLAVSDLLSNGLPGTVYLARSVKNGNLSAIKKVGRLPQNHKVREPSFHLFRSSRTLADACVPR